MTADATSKSSKPREARAVGLFGGSFDPVHAGHLAVARAVLRRFHLDEIFFIPSARPPHKARNDMAAFAHRYAMVALACQGRQRYLPSLAEATENNSIAGPSYSIDTVRHFRQRLRRSQDRLYFITGADAFVEIPTWKNYEDLLRACDFIVVSRPGYKLQALRLVVPTELLGRPKPGREKDGNVIWLRRTAVYILDGLANGVSATEVRRRCRRNEPIRGLVPRRVEEYIRQQGLYA